MSDYTPYIIAAYAIAALALTSLAAYALLRLRAARSLFYQEKMQTTKTRPIQ